MKDIHHDDDDIRGFIAGAREAARLKGACVLEFFTCPACGQQQTASHGFCREVRCQACSVLMPSIVPPLPTVGEVTKAHLTDAMRQVRSGTPEISEKTREYLASQPPAVQMAMTSWACHEVRRALDAVERIARRAAGGHGLIPRKGGDK